MPQDTVSSVSLGGTVDRGEFGETAAIVPVGAILPWAKTITGVPALGTSFVECNGQTLSDAESLLDGQTIPDLNGGARLLYGAAASGATKTEDFLATHTHTQTAHAHNVRTAAGASGNFISGGQGVESGTAAVTDTTAVNANASAGTAWAGYAVVWIMRVK